MSFCFMTCRICMRSKQLSEFISSDSRLLYRCKTCILIQERQNRFVHLNIPRISRCQNANCPDGDIGTDLRLLKLRDDGKIVCMGCYRSKIRSGGLKENRDLLCEFFRTSKCQFCERMCSEGLTFDFFETVNNDMKIIPYTTIVKMFNKNTSSYVNKVSLVCISCARDHLTSYIR